MFGLVLLSSLCLSLSAEAKVVFSHDFENAPAVEKLQKESGTGGILSQAASYAHAGKYGLQASPNLSGSSQVQFYIPPDLPQGVLTFWIYDPLFEGPTVGQNFKPGFMVICLKQDKPEKVYSNFYLDTGRESPYWWFSTCDDTPREGVCTNALRHPGWTRVDFVNPGGNDPRNFIIYIDGREAARTSDKYLALNRVIVRSFWGSGTIYLDDVSYDDDPNNFRPNVLQTVRSGDEANNIQISPGEPVPIEVALSAKGAGAPDGNLRACFLDGRENIVAEKNFKINWKETGDKPIRIEMPAPLGSRLYRFKAAYSEQSTGITDSISVPINVQVTLPAAKQGKHARLVLKKPWQWLAGKPEDTSIPADWSNAENVDDAWMWWIGRKRKDVFAGWYRREISIPAEWKNRRVLIAIDQPQTKARVFVNKNLAGEVSWPGGKIDITNWVKPGSKIELVLFVSALPDVSYLKVAGEILGEGVKLPQEFTDIMQRGLYGEVALETEPASVRIDGVFIQPSVVHKSLGLSFELDGLAPGAKYRLRGSIADAGKPVKTFESPEFTISAVRQVYAFEVPWQDPILWDLGRPYFYDLNAELVSSFAGTADVMLPVRFGFREVTFDGQLVRLNGRAINLFEPPMIFNFANEGLIGWLDKYHLNYVTSNHHNYLYSPGRYTPIMGDHYNFCDEAGIATDLAVSEVGVRKFILSNRPAVDLDPRYWAEYERVVNYAVRRYRNHPGLFFYGGGGGNGQLEMGGMYNPLLMDGIWLKDFSDRPIMNNLLQIETKALDFLHQTDPTRKVISQDSGNFGDSCHITHYAGFMPIQEMIETDEYWRENGTKPYMITEQGAPFGLNWTDATRKEGYGTPDLIGYVAEWSAITKGDRAFHRLSIDQDELTAFEDLTGKIRKADPKSKNTAGVLSGYKNKEEIPCVFNEVTEERSREQWLNWRADGIGLFCCWEPGLSTNAIAQQKYFAPVTGFIAGTPEKRTAKDHNFFPGETLDRQIIILNNGREQAKITCRWELSLNNKKVGGDTVEVAVPAGDKLSVPVKVKLPKGEDCSGLLSMALEEKGTVISQDSTVINVIRPQPVNLSGKVALIDPEGDTTAIFKRLGVKFQRVNFGTDLSGYGVIVLGRRAFLYENKAIKGSLDLGGLTRAGKRILIMEQDEETLRSRFHFRTEYISPRNTFGRIGGHPVLAGLSDDALSFWRGSATLTDGYAIAKNQNLLKLEHNGARWFYIWNDGKEHPRPIKWGNTNNVATVVIMKPETGNFRTLIDCEFGLNFTPLWELDDSAGKIVFCQMDCSGRTETDPAADRLVGNLLQYLDSIPAVTWKKAAYLGGKRGEDLMKSLRVDYRTVSQPKDVQKNEVLIVGENPPENLQGWKNDFSVFVSGGGTLFSLAKSEQELSGWLPFEIGVKTEAIDSTIVDKPAEPLLAGIGNSELYWKGRVNIAVIDQIPEGGFRVPSGVIARVPQGKGQYVFCQIAPDSFNLEERFYLRDSQNLTYRLLQNLMNNLRISMAVPAFLKEGKVTESKLEAIDLTGKWSGCTVQGAQDACPALSDPRWHSINVPGYWEEQNPEWQTYDGHFWYRKGFLVPDKIPENASPVLILGAVDDEDDTFINGQKVGHVGRDTNANDYFSVLRQYAIPKGILREGYNELTILVNDIVGSGGIIGSPQLVWMSPQEAAQKKQEVQPYLFPVGIADDPYCYHGW